MASSSVAAQRYLWGPAWEGYYYQFWDKGEIVNRIRSFTHRGQGISLSAVSAAAEWRLIRAASYYFGSWRKAVEAAGFDYAKVREDIRWTCDEVVRAIRQLRRRGEPLNSRAAQLAHPDLFWGAVRERTFGSWDRALEAAGVNPQKVRKYEHWTADRLRKEIRALAASREALNTRDVEAKHSHLYYAACHRYNSWAKAVADAGIDFNTVALRRPWSKTEILAGIRDLHRQGVHMSDSNVRRRHCALHTAACRTFDSWTRARAKAGLARYDARRHKGAFLAGFSPDSLAQPTGFRQAQLVHPNR